MTGEEYFYKACDLADTATLKLTHIPTVLELKQSKILNTPFESLPYLIALGNTVSELQNKTNEQQELMNFLQVLYNKMIATPHVPEIYDRLIYNEETE